MSRQQTLYLIAGGFIIFLIGLLIMGVNGGWVATGIGTSHSATPGGMMATLFTFVGLIMAFVGGIGELIRRRQ